MVSQEMGQKWDGGLNIPLVLFVNKLKLTLCVNMCVFVLPIVKDIFMAWCDGLSVRIVCIG